MPPKTSKKRPKNKRRRQGPAAQAGTNANGPLVWFGNEGSGVDYSLPARAIAVGDFSFVNELYAAQVDGVAYEVPVGSGAPPPFVGLICRNPQAVRAAFRVFQGWSDATDGDALQLTWYFHPRGNYRLVIQPDATRLAFCCVGFERFVQPVLFMANYVKQIDSTGKATTQFRKYCRGWYHPFYFGAVVFDPARGPVSVVTPILKHQARIVDSTQPPENDLDRALMEDSQAPSPHRRPSKDESSPQFRMSVLQQHFPVTLQRLKRPPVAQAIQTVISDGFSESQAAQAAANLILSASLCTGALHFKGIGKDGLREAVTQGVTGHLEAADSTDISGLMRYEALSKQAMLDGNALLAHSGAQHGRTAKEVIALLLKKGLVDD